MPLGTAIVLSVVAFFLTRSFWPWASELSPFTKLLAICLVGSLIYMVALIGMLFDSSRAYKNVSLRSRMYLAAPLLLAPLAVPALAFLATEPLDNEPAWTVCALSDLMGQDNCTPSVRWLIIGLSLVPAFGLLMLIWWRLCALTEIKWLFERPWSGLGDDVSHANVAEGLARAAIVILIIVACFVPLVYALLAGISTGGAFGYTRSAKAPQTCNERDRCRSDADAGGGTGGIPETPHVPKPGGGAPPGLGDRSSGNSDSDAIREVVAILKKADANSALGVIGRAIGDVNSSLRSQDVSGSLGEIRQALREISAKADASSKEVGALRQPLSEINQALRGTTETTVLESIRASLQKLAAASPTAGPSNRQSEVERSLEKINDTLIGKLVPAVETIRGLRSAPEKFPGKGSPSAQELSELRKSLNEVEQMLRKLNDPAAFESVRKTLQKIAEAMPAGQQPTHLAEVEKSLDRISDTLANKVVPVMDGMGRSMAHIDSTLGMTKSDSGCFDTKFMARADSNSVLMKARGADSGQKVRPVKSHYLPFDVKHTEVSEDERQRIVAFLSDETANAALSIHGFADGSPGTGNEGFASKRALAVADIAARVRPDRKIVDLQWSVGGERSATIKLVEECR